MQVNDADQLPGEAKEHHIVGFHADETISFPNNKTYIIFHLSFSDALGNGMAKGDPLMIDCSSSYEFAKAYFISQITSMCLQAKHRCSLLSLCPCIFIISVLTFFVFLAVKIFLALQFILLSFLFSYDIYCLPPAFRRNGEGTVITGVCLSTSRLGGWWWYPICLMGGTPIWLMEGGTPSVWWRVRVPHLADRGYPHSADWMGVPPS